VKARGLAAVLVGVGVLVAGCGSSGKHAASSPTTRPTTQAAPVSTKAGADGCTHAKPPAFGMKRAQFSKAGKVLAPGEQATIVMKTSCGTVRIRLATDKRNPIPNSIAFLVTKHFYDGLSLFRDVPAFVIQGGDPSNNGTGGPGYQVVGRVPEGYSYQVGDVAMAKTQADAAGAAGSQFFLISGELGKELPTQYGLLGHAADKASLATIARLASFAQPTEQPSKPIYIWSATLVKG
jgi:cyclophilin family peptidyl-prolyl cis-trans isomerase